MSAPLPPLPGVWTWRRTSACVACGGGLAALFAVAVLLAMLISRGNGTATANSTIFYVIGLLLTLACTLASLIAIKKRDGRAALAFTGVVVALAVVMFSFMIADAADPTCEDNVIYLLRCTAGERQDALTLVAQDMAIIVVLGVFAVAGVKLYAFLQAAGHKPGDEEVPRRAAVVLDDGL